MRWGFTEPDPREDLSGRTLRESFADSGPADCLRMDLDEVKVDSLVPKRWRAESTTAPPAGVRASRRADGPSASSAAARAARAALRGHARARQGERRLKEFPQTHPIAAAKAATT